MKAAAPLLFVLALSAQSVIAQPAPSPADNHIDTVQVTAPKVPLDKAINNFVKSYAAPTLSLGKLARWSAGAPICPSAVGLSPDLNVFVSERIRVVAGMVGAPVQAKVPCKTNMTVLFSPRPQALLDAIRAGRSDILGYHFVAQLGAITKVSHPIQAWYGTATRDYNGILSVDDAQAFDECVDANGGSATVGAAIRSDFVCGGASQGTRIKDGEHSEMAAVTVVVDVPKIAGFQIGALADYIAMLALSQTQTFQTCQPLESITNLMSPNCSAPKVQALSEADTAYLKALYKVDPNIMGQAQVGDITLQMETALGGH